MKKIFLLCFCLLLCAQVAYADLELHFVEDAVEEDYTGVWLPVATSDNAIVIDDLIVITRNSVLLVILGNYYTDLPYMYYGGTVFTALSARDEEPIYVTFQLLNNDYMLYKKYFEGKIVSEIVCKKLKGEK